MIGNTPRSTALFDEVPAIDPRAGTPLEVVQREDLLLTAKIMLVDDAESMLDVLRLFLEDAGYAQIETYSDPTVALDKLRSEQPDVLLLDIQMPVVSGLDILAAMRAEEHLSRIPVIVLTAATDADIKLQALNLGAADFLAKPVDPSELALRVRNTLAAKAYQDRLAYYDATTGLPNRTMLMSRLDNVLQWARDSYAFVGLLVVALDRFQRIKDNLGPTGSDALLRTIARRIESTLRLGDLVARGGVDTKRDALFRVGGDEFVVLLAEMERVEDAQAVAQRIHDSFKEALEAGGQRFSLSATVGIAICPYDGSDTETLVRNAYVTTADARDNGGDRWQYFSKELDARSRERLTLETQLRRAVDNGELVLHYQPKVDATTRRAVGFEALVRWQHPELGLVPPGRFIPMAEETGIIEPIGEWVLGQACEQNQAWRTGGIDRLRIAVNVSSHQVHKGTLIKTVERSLAASGLAPELLTIELTESALLENAEESLATLNAVREMGVTLSLDDFGTGYSSLSYLTQLPVQELKIDRAFVVAMQPPSEGGGDGARGTQIVRAIIAMAKSLGLSIVAEGVETREQFEALRDMGCDVIQGFYIARPMSTVEVESLLRKRQRSG